MLKTLIFLLTLSFSSQVMATAKTVERIRVLKSYLAQIERDSPDTLLTEAGLKFKLRLSLFAEAIAAGGVECFYGGWPSKKVVSDGKSYCTSPKNGSDVYESGKCSPTNEIQCQPQLFGPNLCVGFATKSERLNTFKNCEDQFKKQKRDYSYVSQLGPQELEQLKAIEALASSLCKNNPTGSTQKMCSKILKRVDSAKSDKEGTKAPVVSPELKIEDTKVEVKVEETPVVMTPVSTAQEDPSPQDADDKKSNEPSEAECAAMIADNFDKIEDLTKSVSKIMAKYGDKSTWPRDEQSKGDVVDLQEEVLCLELEIFSLGNKLGLDIDCKAMPKKLPPMHLNLTKHTDLENFEAAAAKAIERKMKDLNNSVDKWTATLENSTTISETGKKELQDKIQEYLAERECLSDIDARGSCRDSYTSSEVETKMKSKADYAGRGSDSLVTIYVEKEGKLLPFKTYDEITIQGGLGPKIKQGDMMTPEGVFNITTPTTSTNYFSASKIDYENWKERKQMLEGLPNSMINPADKGGAILIHGAGGSNGCLSFNKNSDSAYFTAIARNKTKSNQPLKMSVYPAPLTEELIESSNSIPGLKMYKNFWNKLSVNYKKEQDRINDKVLSIYEIQDKQ